MIIGDASLDPRKVLGAEITYHAGCYRLTADVLYGNSVMKVEVFFADKDDALEAMAKLDAASYKGPLADAIADKTVDDEDDDEEHGMGFV
jgi:hypothetical protein